MRGEEVDVFEADAGGLRNLKEGFCGKRVVEVVRQGRSERGGRGEVRENGCWVGEEEEGEVGGEAGTCSGGKVGVGRENDGGCKPEAGELRGCGVGEMGDGGRDGNLKGEGEGGREVDVGDARGGDGGVEGGDCGGEWGGFQDCRRGRICLCFSQGVRCSLRTSLPCRAFMDLSFSHSRRT